MLVFKWEVCKRKFKLADGIGAEQTLAFTLDQQLKTQTSDMLGYGHKL